MRFLDAIEHPERFETGLERLAARPPALPSAGRSIQSATRSRISAAGSRVSIVGCRPTPDNRSASTSTAPTATPRITDRHPSEPCPYSRPSPPPPVDGPPTVPPRPYPIKDHNNENAAQGQYLHGIQHRLRRRVGRHPFRHADPTDSHSRSAIRLMCLGWWIGWTSATIARVVYPPPKKRRSTVTTT